MKAKVTVTPQPQAAHNSIFTPGNLVVAIGDDAVICVSTRADNRKYPAGTFSGVVVSNLNIGEHSDLHSCNDYIQFRGKVTLDTTGE